MSREPVSPEQRGLIDRFVASFNQIERALRDCAPNCRGFVDAVARAEHDGRVEVDVAKRLRRAAAVRNVVVHHTVAPGAYAAVPTPATVEELEELAQRVVHPRRAIPSFQKDVEIIAPKDSLASVLALIAKHDFSQFPVYEDLQFRGLLTENGLTRWLARHVAAKSVLDLGDHRVEEALLAEEQPNQAQFVHSDCTIERVRRLFASEPELEAVLVTEHGGADGALLGMATRWDMLRLGA